MRIVLSMLVALFLATLASAQQTVTITQANVTGTTLVISGTLDHDGGPNTIHLDELEFEDAAGNPIKTTAALGDDYVGSGTASWGAYSVTMPANAKKVHPILAPDTAARKGLDRP
ncbi:MAG: hypothetical protein AB7O97_24530 [Planctomycetota bacterium]